MKLKDIPTPALLVDLDKCEYNIKHMAAFFAGKPAGLRPHFKAHRCPEITRRQVQAGTIGVTCAKLAEAEYLAGLGFDHLLVANEIVGADKFARLARLVKQGLDVIVAVDSLDLAHRLQRAGAAHRARFNILLDVNIGMNRCGFEDGPDLRRATHFCAHARNLRLRGVMGYEGHLIGLPNNTAKVRLIEKALSRLTRFAAEMRGLGIPMEIVSAGGTGTYRIAGAFPGITEIQAGSYCVMDSGFSNITPEFRLASTVLVTIISRPRPDMAIGDAGRKSIHPSHGMPVVKDISGAIVENLHAEHCMIRLAPAARHLKIGHKIEIYVPYVDGTFNLHDSIHVMRCGTRLTTWPVSGRGCST